MQRIEAYFPSQADARMALYRIRGAGATAEDARFGSPNNGRSWMVVITIGDHSLSSTNPDPALMSVVLSAVHQFDGTTLQYDRND